MKMEEEISKIGIKAYTLQLLKKKGIFKKNLYVSADLPEKHKFMKALKAENFKDGDELSCRFSHPSKTVHLPRTIANSFEEAYNFYSKNIREGLTIMIHNLMHAKYAGTITLIGDELVLEFVEGDWSADYSLNVDTAVFKDRIATWYLYKDKRNVPYVVGGEVKFKEIDAVGDGTAKKIFINLVKDLDLIKELLSSKFNSLELLIDEDSKWQPLKLLNISSIVKDVSTLNSDGVFEIKTPFDLKRWDKKTKLLISIPANIDRADALMEIVQEIKKYTNELFIGYGILSHPAILLREAGFKVERRISNYKTLKFTY